MPCSPCASCRRHFLSLLRQRKATAGAGLALPNFPHYTRLWRARNLRLRRFGHASPAPENRASFGCASRAGCTPHRLCQIFYAWICRKFNIGFVVKHEDSKDSLIYLVGEMLVKAMPLLAAALSHAQAGYGGVWRAVVLSGGIFVAAHRLRHESMAR